MAIIQHLFYEALQGASIKYAIPRFYDNRVEIWMGGSHPERKVWTFNYDFSGYFDGGKWVANGGGGNNDRLPDPSWGLALINTGSGENDWILGFSYCTIQWHIRSTGDTNPIAPPRLLLATKYGNSGIEYSYTDSDFVTPNPLNLSSLSGLRVNSVPGVEYVSVRDGGSTTYTGYTLNSGAIAHSVTDTSFFFGESERFIVTGSDVWDNSTRSLNIGAMKPNADGTKINAFTRAASGSVAIVWDVATKTFQVSPYPLADALPSARSTWRGSYLYEVTTTLDTTTLTGSSFEIAQIRTDFLTEYTIESPLTAANVPLSSSLLIDLFTTQQSESTHYGQFIGFNQIAAAPWAG